MWGGNPSALLPRVDPERGQTPLKGSILEKLDRFRLTLVYASPALDAVPGTEGV
jgi:hypothetical protein